MDFLEILLHRVHELIVTDRGGGSSLKTDRLVDDMRMCRIVMHGHLRLTQKRDGLVVYAVTHVLGEIVDGQIHATLVV